MDKPDFVELCDMLVVEDVVNFFAGAAAFDDFVLAEDSELVRDGGF